MNKQNRLWRIIAVIGFIVFIMGCALPAELATPTPTAPPALEITLPPIDKNINPTLVPVEQTAAAQYGLAATLAALAGMPTPTSDLAGGGGSGGAGGGSGGSGSGGGAGGSGGAGSGGSGAGGSAGSATQPPPPQPSTSAYVVKQVETLGGEVISGVVCSLTKSFSVLSATPKVTFAFLFSPQSANQGKVAYQYSIPSAGETHDASGTYALSSPDSNGTLHLSLAVSDHVVFKGFDGNIPNRYKFDLVPSGDAGCPSTP